LEYIPIKVTYWTIFENVSKTCPTQTEANQHKLILKHLFGHGHDVIGFFVLLEVVYYVLFSGELQVISVIISSQAQSTGLCQLSAFFQPLSGLLKTCHCAGVGSVVTS
jgi:hypothetical protein